MLSQENYRLRAIEIEDLDFLMEMRSHEETSKFLGTFVFLNKSEQKKWFDNQQTQSDRKFLMFDFKQNGLWSSIGMTRMTEIDTINRSVCIGGDICIDYRGKGHSKAMYDLLFDLSFNYLNMHRVWLLVLAYNIRAIGLYEKLGFIHEGSQRKAIYRDGSYHDYLMMSMLKEEYKGLKNAKTNSSL